MRQPKPEVEKLLNELCRSVDPSREALERLDFELETSAIARKAFGRRHVQLRQLEALARANYKRLPPKLQQALDAMPRTKSFAELIAQAERTGEPAPELDLTPST